MGNTDTDVRIEETCQARRPAADILMRIGDKWTGMVLGVLSAKTTLRYRQLLKVLGGVSQRMLTRTLKDLERDGLVTRTVFPTVPPRVDYALTERGRALAGRMRELWMWVEENREAIEETRREFDARRRKDTAAM